MFVRCAALRPVVAAAAHRGHYAAGAAFRPAAVECILLLRRGAAGIRRPLPQGSIASAVHAPDSRVREVDAACSALIESIHAGDSPWFERVVGQLRQVLAERKDALEQESGNQAELDGATKKNSGRSVQPEPPQEPQTAVHHEEPAWLRTLRLLEAAAMAPAPGTQVQDASGAAPASSDGSGVAAYLASFQNATPEGPAAPKSASSAEVVDHASKVGKDASSAASGAEPAWARALRLLEAAAVPGGHEMQPTAGAHVEKSNAHEHAGEDERMGRYSQMLDSKPGSHASVSQSGESVRMQRYAELLREADNVGQRAAPGASIPPLRFQPSRATPLKNPPAPLPPFPVAETSGPSSTNTPFPPPPPVTSSGHSSGVNGSAGAKSQSAAASARQKKSAADPLSQAVGRGNLAPSVPAPSDDDGPLEDAVLRKEDLVWSEHEFNDGEKENKRVLRKFSAEFKKMASETPDGVRNPRLLTAALDLALACVKCYELDKADAIYRRIIGECRRRGLPWDVKCIQDMATLRCKQHRQADAAELLEELANKAPPHPATFINLGTVYNQLRQYEKAEVWFQQAVNLKGGNPGREDLWNIGICKKNMKMYTEALPMLEQALAEFQEHEPEHPVTIAKLHSSVAGCLHDMGRTGPAADQYRRAHELYVGTVGKRSPLFCSAAEGLAKALHKERRYEEAFDALLEAFEVHAKGDAVHPTPLFENIDLALEIHGQCSTVDLSRFRSLIDAGVANLEQRGLAEDGNSGLVMSRSGKLLSRAGRDHAARASELLSRGVGLIRQSHEAGEADLSHEILEANMLLQTLQNGTANDAQAMMTTQSRESFA